MIAQRVLQTCLDLGVREFVVCAGSRNSDLVHGLLQHQDQFSLYSFFEERSASFFALGRTLAQSRPVAVVTTSGTAVAELLPAVIEAYYQSRPLVLITADRPVRYEGSGAPQAIEQAGLFGIYARTHDLEKPADIDAIPPIDEVLKGPVHFNVRLEEPTQDIPNIHLHLSTPSREPIDSVFDSDALALNRHLEKPGPLLVMAGCLTPNQELIAALDILNVPILADATSGLHAEPAISHLLLRGGDFTARQLEYNKVLRLGGVPSFRQWRDLESQPEIDVLSLSTRPFSGLARHSMLFDQALSRGTCSAHQAPSDWETIETAQADLLEKLLSQYPESEPAQLRSLLKYIPSAAQLFVGNSLPIRELSLVASRKLPWDTYANRGANGIDGNLATCYGLAAQDTSKETWGIFGDLTALYDLAAPGMLTQIPETSTRLVVINNGGGKIFRRLPNFQGLSSGNTATIENHHHFDFQSWAQAWALDYRFMETAETDLSDLEQHALIELRPDEAQTEAFWAAYTEQSP